MRRCIVLVVIASILLMSCASAWERSAATMDGHKVVWQPHFYGGCTLVAIAYVPLPDVVLPDGTVTSGRHSLKVFVDDKRVYQRIETTSNVAGTKWMRHTTEWELIADLKPEQAATEDGWRDPDRRHRYVMREFDDMAGLFALDVYGDGGENFWITLTEYRPREVPVRGMPRKDPAIRDVATGAQP